jgi:cell fate regulator YaaT (PSP1 superfamily)
VRERASQPPPRADRISQPPPRRVAVLPPEAVEPVEPRAPREPVFLPEPKPEPEPDPDTIIDPVAWDAQADAGYAGDGVLHNVVTVRSERTGRCQDYDAGDAVYRRGEIVAIEADIGGLAFGWVTQPSRRAMVRAHLRRALRKATEAEMHTEPRGRRREKEVFRIAKHVAGTLNLPIKIVRAETEPNGRTTVYFASEERIDFRELHRRVSAAAQGRVEPRQIGVRDAARMTGGVGPCGQQLCCSRFLREFAPISIKMAKDQGLVLNPQRVSGLCGRLLCCLTFEDSLYRTQRKLLPKLGKRVVTPKGPGKVRDVDVLSQTIRVFLDTGEIAAFKPVDIQPMFPSQSVHPSEDQSETSDDGPDDPTDEQE